MNSITNMAIPVCRLLSFCVLGLLSLTATAQSDIGWPKPRFYILDIDKATGEGDDIFSYLEKEVSEPENDSCTASWRIFFFRVTAKGKVDSLFHEGTLEDAVTSQIVKNIYSTNGHWKIPKGTKATEKLWFVFPYFFIGHGTELSCSNEDNLLMQNIMQLGESIGKLCLYTGLRGAYFMPPSKNGAGYSKE